MLYTDEQGQYVIQGSLIDTKSRVNLTEARIAKLTQIDFATLPLKDAILIKQGSGARKLVVFGDPNCGYCKKLERDLLALKDVSIYTFLYPILGPDSNVKSRDIWCAREPAKVWRSWMVEGTTPPKAMGPCDSSALERNMALGTRSSRQRHAGRGVRRRQPGPGRSLDRADGEPARRCRQAVTPATGSRTAAHRQAGCAALPGKARATM